MPNPPFGYRYTAGRICPAPPEQRMLRAMRRMRGRGCSFRQIADSLNRAGYRTRRGTEIAHQYVSAALEEKA